MSPPPIEHGQPLIFMKVGVHAQETLEDIIERKNKEFDNTGQIFWGYGGGTCHPLTQVQPFARDQMKRGRAVQLWMHEIESHHDETTLATEFSADGITWNPIPEGITVKGSRYALVLNELEPGDLNLDLSSTTVAIGTSKGKPGNSYISGRVDKGCLEVSNQGQGNEDDIKRISLFADLQDPFAVLLR
ncbi:MAG: hypothetical protein HUJ31_00205 [Pseudomonadales bacterium]|nr:hypothetical protein [Pseudomonadales bacterium]